MRPTDPKLDREPRSVPQLLEATVAARPEALAYRHKLAGTWHDVSWNSHRDRVREIARSLIALGVQRGDRVAVLAQTGLNWVQLDFGILAAGAATVGVYPSSPAADCAFILDHSESTVVFIDDAEQLAKLRQERAALTRLTRIVMIAGDADDADVLDWRDFLAAGAATDDAAVTARIDALDSGDLAALVYTSGTTDRPKGAMITHGNLVFTSWTAAKCLDLRPDCVALLFLPLAHVFARLIVHCFVRLGRTIAFAESLARVPENLREVQPHLLPSVPRVFEKFRERVETNVREASGSKRAIFHWALAVGHEVSRRSQRGEALSWSLRVRHALADRLALHKVREAFGGRLVYAISGGAPLDRELALFFHACGVLILEGYGMTENTSFSNVNRLGANRFGTVGPAGPGIEMRVAEDGEILFRAPNVMAGYFKNPEETAEAIDAEGWLHTGDIGEIDAEGYLRITDRKKDLIITAGGKNVAPQRVERALCASAFVAQAMVFGDRRKYLVALLVVDLGAVRRWAKAHGIDMDDADQLVADPRVRAHLHAEVDGVNERLAPFESVKNFHLLTREFGIDSGELTATMKLRRRVVTERYRSVLEALYPR